MLMLVCCSGSPDDEGNVSPVGPGPDPDDTPSGEFDPSKVGLEYDDGTNIAFNIKIAIDREGWEMRGEEFFKSRLKTQWEEINTRFMELDKLNMLRRNYIFIPDLDDIIVYDFKDANSHWNVPVDYADRIDFNKYQCLVAYDFVTQEGEGGGGCGDDGHGLANILVVRIEEPGVFHDHFDDATPCDIVHELGHFRGIIDLYPMNIASSANPVSHQGYNPMDGIMKNQYYTEWNEYELRCMNYIGARKVYRSYDTCLYEMFPDFIEFTVMENGEPVDGCTVNLYPLSGGAIREQPQFTHTVEGSMLRLDARPVYFQSTAVSETTYWHRYSDMYLVEAVNNDTGNKGYYFMPIWEPHWQGLIDKDDRHITGKSFFRKTIDIASE